MTKELRDEFKIKCGEKGIKLLDFKIQEFLKTKEPLYKIIEIPTVEGDRMQIPLEKELIAESEEELREKIQKKRKTKEDYNFIEFDDKGNHRINLSEIVKYLSECFDFKTIYGKKSEEIWFYEDGIWKPKGREFIETEIEKVLEGLANTRLVHEVLNSVKRKTAIDRKIFDDIPIELIPLKNGVLNLVTLDFFDYTPKYYFKTKIDVNYNPNAKCKKWLKFVKEAFYKEDVPVVQEWWGFCLYRDYFIKKGFIGVGEQDTGKSVFQNVIFEFFGTQNISGLNLQKIVKDNNFSKSSLYNKYVNLYDDMSARDINEGGGFKMVTGRSPITAEYKFGDEFQFINYAKMTYCCNKIPPIKDTEDITYYNRWLPIPFDNVVPEGKQDKFLVKKLTTDDELSGILNWALVGLKRILRQKRFSYDKNSEEIKEIMDKSSSSLAEFAHNCLEKSLNSTITKQEMFNFYTNWAQKNNKKLSTIEELGKKLPRYAKYLAERHGKVRFWKHVKFKNKGDSGNLDTLDTISKNKGIGNLDIYNKQNSKKVSKVSEEHPELNYTIEKIG